MNSNKINDYYGLIYRYVYLPDGRIYYGQVGKRKNKNLEESFIKRQKEHLSSFSNLKFHNLLKNELNNFKLEIIEFCNNEEELNIREEFWIQTYKTNDYWFGFNLTSGASPPVLRGEKNYAKSLVQTTQTCLNIINDYLNGVKVTTISQHYSIGIVNTYDILGCKNAYTNLRHYIQETILNKLYILLKHKGQIPKLSKEKKSRKGIPLSKEHKKSLKEAQNKPEVREKHSIRMKTKNPMNNQDTLQKMIQTVNKPEIKKKKSLSQPNRIVVEQYTLANIFVAKYHSLNEAVRSLGLKHHSGIGNCLSGKNKTAHGFKWKSVN